MDGVIINAEKDTPTLLNPKPNLIDATVNSRNKFSGFIQGARTITNIKQR
jgi:hypothetical protein